MEPAVGVEPTSLPLMGSFFLTKLRWHNSGGRDLESSRLQGMSLLSYQTAPPRNVTKPQQMFTSAEGYVIKP